MIDVKLFAATDENPIDMASLAAGICYQSKIPKIGARLNFKEKLFEVGHHTIIEHHSATFIVESLPIGDITFGMHLANPFYNSDQRSGRFCSDMFLKPDYTEIENHIKIFWPDISSGIIASVTDYVKTGVEIYRTNIAKATEAAGDFVAEERPFASAKIKGNIPKYAQEQMRMFISTIFPTAFLYTVDNSALVAMYESAWTPAMRYLTGEMARLFVEKYPEPETSLMFREDRRRKSDWGITVKNVSWLGILYEPAYELIDVFGEENFCLPEKNIMHPVDKLHFIPEMMENSIGDIKAEVKVSVATMAQDQRHRTIRRGLPRFTGDFYIPPVLRKLKLEKEATKIMRRWFEVSNLVPDTLAMVLAPYGAMVKYTKSGSFNAVAHEQFKRHCWCTQQEICHLGLLQRLAIEKKFGSNSPLLGIFEPPCFRDGICSEGDSYCGRDKAREKGNYFLVRKA